MGTSQGFWSYVHKDDEAMRGVIRRLAGHLSDEYGVLTGDTDLDLFLDSAKLKLGEKWRQRIREALESTTFFIPIITPRYFASEECRGELLSFAEQAESLGLEALILPLYFVEVPAIEEGSEDDPLVKLISERQWEDWRNLRLLDETTQAYRTAVNRLALRLREISKASVGLPAQASSGPVGDDDDQPPPNDKTSEASPTFVQPTPVKEVTDEEKGGMLELLAEGEATFPRLVQTLNAIGEEIQNVGDLAEATTSEIKESDANGGGFKGRLAVINRLAQTLREPSVRLEELGSEYVADLLVLDPAMKQLIKQAGEESSDNPDAVESFLSSVQEMVTGSRSATGGIAGMIEALNGSAEMSRELAVPIKRMRTALQSMVDSQRLIDSWQEHIDSALSNAERSA